MMFDRITEAEREMIDFYRKQYTDDIAVMENFAPLSKILRVWEREKSWLYNLFGQNLIISRPVKIDKTYESIIHEIEEDSDNDTVIRRFFDHYYDKISNYFYGPQAKEYIIFEGEERYYYNLPKDMYTLYRVIGDELVTNYHIAKKVWCFENVKVTLPKSNTVLSLKKGETKIMRVIQKLVDELELDKELFESFRVHCSRYFNTATLSGNLCLSIHPLDFLTMSDNDNSWHSCMSWQHKGCYRRGTVEMMNSPNVVIAYLTDKNMLIDGCEWNSKQWRQLIVIDDDFICGVKGYPYEHDALTTEALRWLRELMAQANPHTEYTDVEVYNCYNQDNNLIGNLDMSTNVMYNDFGCTPNSTHLMVRNAYVHNFELNYSGYSECMCCGGIEDCYNYEDYDDGGPTDMFPTYAESLICRNCGDIIGICQDCGDLIRRGQGTAVPDDESIMYCHNCADYYIKVCPITNKTIWTGGANGFEIFTHSPCGLRTLWLSCKAWDEEPEEWARIANCKPESSHWSWRRYNIDWENITDYGKVLFGNN